MYTYETLGRRVDYNLHNPKTLNPIPPIEPISEWEADYAKMKEDMIYEQNKQTFEELVINLSELKKQLQVLNWTFKLELPFLT